MQRLYVNCKKKNYNNNLMLSIVFCMTFVILLLIILMYQSRCRILRLMKKKKTLDFSITYDPHQSIQAGAKMNRSASNRSIRQKFFFFSHELNGSRSQSGFSSTSLHNFCCIREKGVVTNESQPRIQCFHAAHRRGGFLRSCFHRLALQLDPALS